MSRMQRHLLAAGERADLHSCIVDELANKASQEHMGEPVNHGNVQKSTGGRRSNSQQCEACGSKGHGFNVCKFKTATCHHCHQKDHIRCRKVLFKEGLTIPEIRE